MERSGCAPRSTPLENYADNVHSYATIQVISLWHMENYRICRRTYILSYNRNIRRSLHYRQANQDSGALDIRQLQPISDNKPLFYLSRSSKNPNGADLLVVATSLGGGVSSRTCRSGDCRHEIPDLEDSRLKSSVGRMHFRRGQNRAGANGASDVGRSPAGGPLGLPPSASR
jgi:hypothetical protein